MHNLNWKKLLEVANIDIDTFMEWHLADFNCGEHYCEDAGGGVWHFDELENSVEFVRVLDFLIDYFKGE